MTVMIVFVVFIIIFVIYGYVSNYVLQNHVVYYLCGMKEWEGSRFVLLADLHGAHFGEKNEKLLHMIHESKPDGILIAGDMVVKNGKGIEEAYHLCKELAKQYPVYYGLGNHEIRLENKEDYLDGLRERGVTVLDNSSVILEKKGEKLKITGLTLGEEAYHKFWESGTVEAEDMEALVGKTEADCFHLLIAHNPDYFESYAKWGSDIVVSGHVHGGIMTFPFGGVISPALRIFPKYTHGIYQSGKSTMVLSRGLGLHHIKLRFFNYPEMITIVFGNK